MAAEPLPPLLGRRKLVGGSEETTSGTFITTITTPFAENMYDIKYEVGDFFSEGERQPQGNYVGSVDAVLGKQPSKLTYTIDIRPGGNFLAQLTGAGYKATTGTYAPSSDLSTRKTWSFMIWEDGMVSKMAGAACKVTIEGEVGKKLTAKFEWSGFHVAVIDQAMPARAPIQTQPYISRAITLTMGGSAIAKVSKYTIDLGASVVEREDVAGNSQGIAHCLVEDINPKITLDPEARKVADKDSYGLYLAGTSVAVVLALTSGANTLTFTAARAQRTKVSTGERDKMATHDHDLMCRVSSGDDALTAAEV